MFLEFPFSEHFPLPMGLTFSQIPVLSPGEGMIEFRELVFEWDHDFPYGTYVEEMGQIEDVQGSNSGAYMDTYVFVSVVITYVKRNILSK